MRIVLATLLLIPFAQTPGCDLPSPSDYQLEEKTPSEPAPEPEPVTDRANFSITTIAPNHGKPSGLELVEIQGGGFRETSRVFFGGSESPDVTVTSDQKMYALTPPHSPAAVTVRIVNIDGATTALQEGFVYEKELTVEAIEPSEGPSSGGSPFELRGTGFTGVRAVLFDGREALQLTVLDDETILGILPTHPVGKADIYIVGATEIVRSLNAFHFFAPPTLSGLSPLTAPLDGGGTLTLTGEGLTAEAQISIGGAPAPHLATAAGGSRLVVRIPPGAPGPANVSVSTPYGQTRLENALTYLDDLNHFGLLNLWPSSGPASGGGEMVLVVAGLMGEDVLEVTIGGEAAAITQVLPEQGTVLVTVPPGEPDTAVDVALVIDGEAFVLGEAYSYVPSLQLSEISPTQGSTDGGTTLLLRGLGFLSGAVDVFVGALPATDIVVLSDEELQVTTPIGSPGHATVRIEVQGREADLKEAFTYIAGETKIYGLVPDMGAIAGNTWVRIYGTDLPPHLNVQFGETGATWVERLSPTTAVLRTPRAEEIGSVDVRITAGPQLETTVAQPFTYFDPTARWGGTWGPPIDRSINITVLEPAEDTPIEGAVVILGNQTPPQYKGYTDDRGQVTLSGPDLEGAQTVTAALFGASASSIVDFDAENVTLFLSAPSEGGSGGGGELLEPGTVTGRVHGMGKYIILPPWDCAEIQDAPPGFCEPCTDHSDCSNEAPLCTQTATQSAFCTGACDTDADCPEDFICTTASVAEKRCVSDPGRQQARCFVSSTSLLSTFPPSSEDNILDIDDGELTFTLTNSRLGEVAVYCFGGAARTVNGEAAFRPLVMGLVRHLFVLPGTDPNTELPNPALDVDITLNIPLSRAVQLTIGEQPLRPDGPHETEARAFLELGSDGFIPLSAQVLPPHATDLVFSGLPKHMSGVLYDAEYVFHASAVTNTPETLPSSDVLRTQLGSLDDGAYLHFDGASWQSAKTGYQGDVLDLRVESEDSVFAITEQGSVIHYDGVHWSAQPVTPGPALRGIDTDLAGGIVIVGDAGRILRWNGAGWSHDLSPTKRDLRDVATLGPSLAIAVGQYALIEWNGDTWAPIAYGPPKDLNAIWSTSSGNAWSVGTFGVVLQREGNTGQWSAVNVPVLDDLHSIWGTSGGFLTAVGDSGTIIMASGDGIFTASPSPTKHNLHGVWGRSSTDIYAVGNAATVVHFNGIDWSLVTTGSLETSLQTIGGSAQEPWSLFSMGLHAVHLGPFLTVPDFASPRPNELWLNQTLEWTATGDTVASFQNYRMFGPTGSTAWSIMAPGALERFKLPDINAIENQLLFPNGTKRMVIYRVRHEGFDINKFDGRIFRLMDWRAWVLMTYLFDDNSTTVETGTVPGT